MSKDISSKSYICDLYLIELKVHSLTWAHASWQCLNDCCISRLRVEIRVKEKRATGWYPWILHNHVRCGPFSCVIYSLCHWLPSSWLICSSGLLSMPVQLSRSRQAPALRTWAFEITICGKKNSQLRQYQALWNWVGLEGHRQLNFNLKFDDESTWAHQ